ncbi:hypothetical protein KY285_013605 [Solanum tuberosum]|nr:hypothetical protein KY285_013605 [Solanum tuberosum]
MQQQQPSSKMAHQGLITRATGIWYYKCRICLEVFTSSQGLAGHQHKHMSQGTWIRGMPHYKLFCPSTNLPTLYDQLGSRKSTPTVVRGQGRFYRPRTRNPIVQGPQRFPGCPQSIHDQSHKATVPHVIVPSPAPDPLLI